MEDKTCIYQAFAEIDDILMHSEEEIQNKIPEKLKELFKNQKDSNYVVNIDYSLDINDQKLLLETKEILSLIYRDYLCSEEERAMIIKNNLKVQEEFEKKYNVTEIFKYRNQHNMENLPVKVEKGKWYEKIIDKIRKLFKK